MHWLIRAFFRTLRRVLTPFMLLGDALTSPKGVQREPEAQRRVDEACTRLRLYHFRACPFCIKVRREMKRLSLNIALCNALHDSTCRAELQQGGGEIKVPCLRIEEADGVVRWMYESDDIIAWLRGQFAD